MLRTLRPRSAYDVMAAIAFFAAVAGGSAYAAATIGSGDIKNDAVRSRHVKTGAVKSAELGARSVGTGEVIDGALLRGDFKPGQLRPGGPAAGDLTGTYPSPRLRKPGAPINVAANPNGATDPCFADPAQTLVLCGTSTQRWTNGGFSLPGIQVWKDRLGQVHIRGSATISTGPSSLPLLRLPAGMRPQRSLGVPAVTGPVGNTPGGTALLFIDAAEGFLALYQQTEPNQLVVHFGEIVFRTDA